ncbi:MAG: penicillin-binding protein 2 [Clostridiales bacterium]|nr:penicillin-binding protein 2 [Clostridiales bacterium]
MDELSYTNIKRALIAGIFLIFIIFLLIIRLFFIQVVKSQDYSKKAVQQRLMNISLGTDRGNIYDRNLIPFTAREKKKYIIIYPAYIQDITNTSALISKATGLSPEYISNRIKAAKKPLEFLYTSEENEYFDTIEKGKLKGVIIIEKKQRYSESSLCRHLIGYISKADKKGEMGIEKSMDSYLTGGNSGVIAVVDSSKNIIPGLGFRKVEGNLGKLSIKLTLDYHIQKITEDILKKYNLNGSIIVMDIKTGDILAMSSYPDFDQNNVQNYIYSHGEELINKGVWAYDLGSVFKTVVTAAALENENFDIFKKYLCKGSIDIGNITIQCSTHKTHENKELTIQDAFALSCNTAFVKIGMEIGEEAILDMAKKFGFGEKLCFELFEEKPGYIPKPKEEGIANISIGQGKIQVTPLQVTSMMATIANNGISMNPRLVDELINDDGVTIKKIEKIKPKTVISSSTAFVLKEMLRRVTIQGTGKAANIDELGGSSGKTGTAETGINFGKVTHGWFSGFIPSIEPQYAITVFINDGKSGGSYAAPIFKEVAEEILYKIKR